jgi:UDP-N-acetylglucosamine 2-epimerase
MQHPVTTEYELSRQHTDQTLQAVRDTGIPTLWFWPNVDAGSDGTSAAIRAFREQHRPDNIRFFKNMAPTDFLRLLYNSRCLIGNSSVGVRECSYLGVPVVNIGSRQDGRERGANVLDVGYDRDEATGAIAHHMRNGRYQRDTLYGDGAAGERIAARIACEPLHISKRLAY